MDQFADIFIDADDRPFAFNFYVLLGRASLQFIVEYFFSIIRYETMIVMSQRSWDKEKIPTQLAGFSAKVGIYMNSATSETIRQTAATTTRISKTRQYVGSSQNMLARILSSSTGHFSMTQKYRQEQY